MQPVETTRIYNKMRLTVGSMQAQACLFMLYMEDEVFETIARQNTLFLRLFIITNSE